MTASMNGSAEPLHGFCPGLTISQAASTLGVSPSTVRRWVRSGRLRADQVTVGDGFEYRISLEGLEAVKGSTNSCAESSVEDSAQPNMNGSTEDSAAPILDASTERSAALAAYNARFLAPLTAVIERQAETIERQAQQLIGQAETIGRQGAELEAERRVAKRLLSERDAAEASRRRDHRRLRIGLAVAGALVFATALAPTWVR